MIYKILTHKECSKIFKKVMKEKNITLQKITKDLNFCDERQMRRYLNGEVKNFDYTLFLKIINYLEIVLLIE